MLRRQHGKQRLEPRHRKSTSSTNGVHLEHLDAEIAQRDAQIAAQQAFTRAHRERCSAEMSLFPPLAPSPHRLDPNSINRDDKDGVSPSQEPNRGLPRRQSVRFIAPYSSPSRTPARGQAYVRPLGIDLGPDPFRVQEDHENDDLRPSVPKAVSQLPFSQLKPHRKPPPVPVATAGKDGIHVLVAEDDHYTPEDDIASGPSSYRRIRRSRSMFTSDVRSSQDESCSSPNFDAGARPLQSSLSCRFLDSGSNKENVQPYSTPALRAPKSMSFLRTRRGRNDTMTNSDVNIDDNIRVHENKMLVKARSTLFFGSKGRKEMRKSLRSSSNNGGPQASGINITPPSVKDETLKVKARQISRSWKVKLKGIFRLSRSENDVPEQHIEARKTHVSDAFGSITSSRRDPSVFGGYDAMSGGSLQQVPWKLPSLHTSPSNPAVQSREGSLERMFEQDRRPSDDRSLTSWSNSGPSTLTSQQQQAWREWERQRLSVIKENGKHAPSPSLKRPGLGLALGSMAEDGVAGVPVSSAPVVDSQRVYSALMRRLEETRQVARLVDQQRTSSGEYSHTSGPSSSWDPSRVVQATPPTIRCVLPSADLVSPGPQVETPTRAPKVPLGIHSAREYAQATGGSRGHGNALAPPLALVPPPGIKDSSSGRTLSDRPSAFFGSPTSHLFRTTSPYRRALQRSMDEEEKISAQTSASVEGTASDCGTQIRCTTETTPKPGMEGSLAEHSVNYSESVYSDASEEDRTKSRLSFGDNFGEGPSTLADVSMSVDPPVTYRPTGERVNSSISSIDWKTWLSANVAKLEPSSTPKASYEVEYVLPSMPDAASRGHVRETAQIHEEDDSGDSAQPSPATRMPRMPTTPLSTIEQNVVKISPPQRSVKRATPPLLLHAGSGSRKFSENDSLGAAPPIPMRSPLRSHAFPITKAAGQHAWGTTSKTASKGAAKLLSPPASAMSSPGLSAAVQKQFGPVLSPVVHHERNDKEMTGMGNKSRGTYDGRGTGYVGAGTGSSPGDVMWRNRRNGIIGADESSRAFI